MKYNQVMLSTTLYDDAIAGGANLLRMEVERMRAENPGATLIRLTVIDLELPDFDADETT